VRSAGTKAISIVSTDPKVVLEARRRKPWFVAVFEDVFERPESTVRTP
jgi:hypothetical protein